MKLPRRTHKDHKLKSVSEQGTQGKFASPELLSKAYSRGFKGNSRPSDRLTDIQEWVREKHGIDVVVIPEKDYYRSFVPNPDFSIGKHWASGDYGPQEGASHIYSSYYEALDGVLKIALRKVAPLPRATKSIRGNYY